MTEPARDVLHAKFSPALGLEVYDPEDFYGPVLWNSELADLSAADKFLQESNFPRVTEWTLDVDDEYIADVEFVGEELPIDEGDETVRLIDLTTADGVAPAAMESLPQRAPEVGHRNLDHETELE